MPHITVVIPAYNASAYLREAIDSVLNQSFTDFEVLVIDDGSTDNTKEIAESYESKVRCISQENRGLSEARNRGITEARGDLIAFLDADDYWLPEKLSGQMELMSNNSEVIACFTLTEYFDESGSIVQSSVSPNYENLVEALLLYSCVIGPPSSAMICRSALNCIGFFDPQFSQCADWDMWLRLAEFGKIDYVEKPLVRYRFHSNNMSKNIALLESDTFNVLDKFFSKSENAKFLDLKNKCYSNHWIIISGSYLHIGKIGESLRCLRNAISLYPKNIRGPLRFPLRLTKRILKVNS